MTSTPNHALQRTRSAVTAAASDLRFSATMQPPRPLHLSLSLGSLGLRTMDALKRMSLCSILLSTCCLFTACSHIYYLPGHSQANYTNPPPITIAVGERRLVAREPYLNLLPPAPTMSMVRSSDPQIVAVEHDFPHHRAFLVARVAGHTTVRYWPDFTKANNRGFIVYVHP